jgi:hypothetical protein
VLYAAKFVVMSDSYDEHGFIDYHFGSKGKFPTYA